MAWSHRQKRLVHEYARFAGLSDVDYRTVLCHTTGAFTATAGTLDQVAWEHVMTRLEAILEEHVRCGAAPSPPRRRVGSLTYWRRRFPRAGEMSSRQRHKMVELWERLKPTLPEAKRTDAYLRGIAQKICGEPVADVWNPGAWLAWRLINALQDRLRYAERRAS